MKETHSSNRELLLLPSIFNNWLGFANSNCESENIHMVPSFWKCKKSQMKSPEWRTAMWKYKQRHLWPLFNQSFCYHYYYYHCRTHRGPTYPWYFLLLLGPDSDFYSKGLICHIQVSGSPQPIHFLKAHHVSSPNTNENMNTKTKTVTKTMTKTKTPREWLKQ